MPGLGRWAGRGRSRGNRRRGWDGENQKLGSGEVLGRGLAAPLGPLGKGSPSGPPYSLEATGWGLQGPPRVLCRK